MRTDDQWSANTERHHSISQNARPPQPLQDPFVLWRQMSIVIVVCPSFFGGINGETHPVGVCSHFTRRSVITQEEKCASRCDMVSDAIMLIQFLASTSEFMDVSLATEHVPWLPDEIVAGPLGYSESQVFEPPQRTRTARLDQHVPGHQIFRPSI